MVSLLLAVALTSVTSEQQLQQNYADAYRQSVAEDKPLMVVVAAPWCPACNVLKEKTIRTMAQSGELDAVSLVVVNRDENPKLARQLTKGDQLLPQIIVFSKSETGGWQRRRLTGYQSKQPVRSLIRRALGKG
ncbi:MAG: thioredoxin family protein [Pirellulales bacterium]|nr:thioredoxin family protein [Pirellulales bacterium]